LYLTFLYIYMLLYISALFAISAMFADFNFAEHDFHEHIGTFIALHCLFYFRNCSNIVLNFANVRCLLFNWQFSKNNLDYNLFSIIYLMHYV